MHILCIYISCDYIFHVYICIICFFQKELSGVGGALGGGGGGAASSKIGSLLRSGVSMCPTTLGTAPTEAACRVGISNRRNNLFEAAGVAEWLTHEWLSRMKYIVTSNINA